MNNVIAHCFGALDICTILDKYRRDPLYIEVDLLIGRSVDSIYRKKSDSSENNNVFENSWRRCVVFC